MARDTYIVRPKRLARAVQPEPTRAQRIELVAQGVLRDLAARLNETSEPTRRPPRKHR
ncbi:hypothetical protein [Tateyamaria sp. SN6-1]|uniref:hypothetical protein n=1 Tax=Tateyamaria sp. SN6-1 TaxID=3092148 RepID=UPI0039F4B326